MKLSTGREALLRPLQSVIGVVERRQTMPILANVLLAARNGQLSITATDLEVELVATVELDVESDGEVTVPGRKLLDICKALPEGASVSLAHSGEKVTVRSGRSRFTLTTLPAAEFPTVEDINADKGIDVPQSTLARLLEKTHFAMAQQDVRYYLNGLLIETGKKHLRAVATDGHRLALCQVELDGGKSAGEAGHRTAQGCTGIAAPDERRRQPFPGAWQQSHSHPVGRNSLHFEADRRAIPGVRPRHPEGPGQRIKRRSLAPEGRDAAYGNPVQRKISRHSPGCERRRG